MKILVNAGAGQAGFYTDEARARINALGDVTWVDLKAEELAEALPGMDVLFAGWGIPRMDARMLEKAGNLRLIAYTGGTVAPFMTEDMRARGIRMLSGNRLMAVSVAEAAVFYMLLSQRYADGMRAELARGGWKDGFANTRGLYAKKVGLIGCGMITRALIPLLRALGARVYVASDYFTREDEAATGAVKAETDELFARCDIVSMHESLTADTYHMVDARRLALMQSGALIVNTARGALIDERALEKEVLSGRIRAALDVYETEPLPADSPLRDLDNVILFPHCAGPTFDMREQITLALAEDVKRWMRGEEPLENEITYAYGAHMTDSALVDAISRKNKENSHK